MLSPSVLDNLECFVLIGVGGVSLGSSVLEYKMEVFVMHTSNIFLIYYTLPFSLFIFRGSKDVGSL